MYAPFIAGSWTRPPAEVAKPPVSFPPAGTPSAPWTQTTQLQQQQLQLLQQLGVVKPTTTTSSSSQSGASSKPQPAAAVFSAPVSSQPPTSVAPATASAPQSPKAKPDASPVAAKKTPPKTKKGKGTSFFCLCSLFGCFFWASKQRPFFKRECGQRVWWAQHVPGDGGVVQSAARKNWSWLKFLEKTNVEEREPQPPKKGRERERNLFRYHIGTLFDDD